MWALLILASCGPGVAEVLPAGSEELPANPTLYVTLIDPARLRFEAEDGSELPFTSKRLAGDFSSVTVRAPEGTKFSLSSPQLRGRGPWRVAKTTSPELDRSAPTLSTFEELAWEECTDSNGWELASDRRAPAWELELTSDGKVATAFDSALFVGAHGCGRTTHRWNTEDVSVRVRALFSDGSVGEWSNAVVLSTPTPSLFAPVRRFIQSGDFVPLAAISTLVLLGAMMIVAIAVFLNRKLNA